MPSPQDFEIVESPVPSAGQGGVLRRTIYLSLDPYMRGRMSEGPSYARGVDPNDVMLGGTVSQVIESNIPSFAPGDFVLGFDGWQLYGASDGKELRKLDPADAPISTALGVLGMPGLTAYVGLLDVGQFKPGESVVVSAAAGAVGAIVGQIARLKGAGSVVGIAGSREKCDHVVRDLGFDACVSHRDPDLAGALGAVCPKGIDIYFENVGGAVFAAALQHLNEQARIPLCGLISEYNNESGSFPGVSLRPVLVKRAMIKGFIVFDHAARTPAFLEECGRWVREGQIKYREDIVEGLDQAPVAFRRLFEGTNLGKLLVRVSDDPTRR
jgi:NADPH-dependent curcumin reductase CurA